jgi:hypothetical protein
MKLKLVSCLQFFYPCVEALQREVRRRIECRSFNIPHVLSWVDGPVLQRAGATYVHLHFTFSQAPIPNSFRCDTDLHVCRLLHGREQDTWGAKCYGIGVSVM